MTDIEPALPFGAKPCDYSGGDQRAIGLSPLPGMLVSCQVLFRFGAPAVYIKDSGVRR